MIIEKYSDKYHDDVFKIIKNFFNEVLRAYDQAFNDEIVEQAIQKYRELSFLMIKDGHCEGVLAGIEVNPPLNSKRVFQEVIWYVNEHHRLHGVMLLNKAMELLKEQGFSSIVLACMHNSKTEKLFNLYQRLGFLPFETHFIREL